MQLKIHVWWFPLKKEEEKKKENAEQHWEA